MSRKKLFLSGLLIIFLFTGVLTNNYIAQAVQNYDTIAKNYSVKVYIDEAKNEVQFTSSSGRPFIALNRTFVPYRVLAERMGATVGWEQATKKVSAVSANGNNRVEMTIGVPTFTMNGSSQQMDVEPFVLSAESRTYIPARYLTEGLGYSIDYAKDANGGQIMYIVAFTKGQSEAERKAVLDEVSKNTTVAQPPVNQDLNNDKVVVNGNNYTIGGNFEGTTRTEKYIIKKYSQAIGAPANVFSVEPKDGARYSYKCTSHPALNTLTTDTTFDTTGEVDWYFVAGTGYSIQLQKGMVLEFEVSNGDHFTVQI